LGVLAVQGERLDVAYMRQMAAGLEVGDLLERALVEASPFRGGDAADNGEWIRT
jgi:hypothetical protein